MSISQFDDTLRKSATPAGRGGHIRIDVGGPLELDPGVEYRKPFVIRFEVIQSPLDAEGKEIHDPAQARRAGGVVVTDGAGGRWDHFVEVEPDFFRSAEARGVGVAVLPQDGEFAYETLTWCDHVMLDMDGEAAD